MYTVSYSKLGIMMKQEQEINNIWGCFQYLREMENRAWEGEWTRAWRDLYNWSFMICTPTQILFG